MSHYPRAIPGDNLVLCDICGAVCRMSETKKTWDHLRVCLADWDPKHPQLSLRGKVDSQAVFDGRPEPADKFIDMDTGNVTVQTLFPGCFDSQGNPK